MLTWQRCASIHYHYPLLFNSGVCGYHGYKDIWTNAHGGAGVRPITCIIYNMLCSLHGGEA